MEIVQGHLTSCNVSIAVSTVVQDSSRVVCQNFLEDFQTTCNSSTSTACEVSICDKFCEGLVGTSHVSG